MNTRNFLAVVSVCCLAALANIAFVNVAFAVEASHEVLAHWVGDWTSTGNGGDAGTDGESNSLVGKPTLAKADWTLDDKFVQGTNSDASGKPLGIWMLHFDDKSGNYQVWYFTAAGKVLQWNGTWSEAHSTMTWSGNDMTWFRNELGVGNAIRLTGYTKFEGNKQSWELNFDQDGKVTTDSGSLQKK